jgi:hypothetical protein
VLQAILKVGAFVGDELVGVAVVERPKAAALCNGVTFELSRVACPGREAAPHSLGAACALSRGAWKAMAAIGARRLVSYTRTDEPGAAYAAAGYVATALVEGREWTSGNKASRWLPGLYEPSTEIVDRVRWEIGPDAAATRVKRDESGEWKAAA